MEELELLLLYFSNDDPEFPIIYSLLRLLLWMCDTITEFIIVLIKSVLTRAQATAAAIHKA